MRNQLKAEQVRLIMSLNVLLNNAFVSIGLGFHDAVGNAITLSVASPKHLQKLGLITKSIDDAALDINYLFSLAIDQVIMSV
jgi:hypothetical protein